MKKIIITISLIFLYFFSNAQSVAINNDGSSANSNSILDVKSTDKGILIPRMSKTERNAISTAATGLLVFVNAPDTVGFSYYNGSNWVWIASGNYATDTTAWKLTGNNNATSQSFIGTVNDTALRFRIRNRASGIIDSTSQNTAFGYESLRFGSAAGTANTTFGFEAGKFLIAGTRSNVIMGRGALSSTNNSTQNVVIGDSAMGRASNSFGNTAVGFQSLKSFRGLSNTYTYNTAIGYLSQSATTGNTSPTLSNFNTSVGGYSMADNVSGQNNTAVGVSALRFNDSSSNNTAIGMNAMAYFKSNGSTLNVAVGTRALENDTIGVWNTAIGAEAMRFANNSSINAAVGYRSLKQIKSGSENSAFGIGAMEFKDTASFCVAIGRFALSGQISNKVPDIGSVAVGWRAGQYNNAGYNTFIGCRAGETANSNPLGITGGETVTVGALSLNSLQSGASNSALGYAALFENVAGNKNIAIGGNSLHNLNSSNNIGIGYDAGAGVTSGANNIFIGNNSGGSIQNFSNKLFIENSNADSTAALIYGDFAADSLDFNGDVQVKKYTRLGQHSEGAPAIKMKKLVIPSGPAIDAFQSYPIGSGITDAKVIGVQIFVSYAGDWKIPASYRDAAGFEFNYQVQNNNIVIINKAGNSANIGAKPFTVLITYEE